MKIDNWEKLPVAAFLLNFGYLVIFPLIYVHWMSVDKPLVFVVAGLLPVIITGAIFFFVSIYTLRFTGYYFHRMASKGLTIMKCYTLFEIVLQEVILIVSLYVCVSSIQMWM
jgi:hypothetical protein